MKKLIEALKEHQVNAVIHNNKILVYEHYTRNNEPDKEYLRMVTLEPKRSIVYNYLGY